MIRSVSGGCGWGRIVLCVAAAALCVAPLAQAGSIVLVDPQSGKPSGWEAAWDDTFDPYVEIVVDVVTQDTVFIEKTAQFMLGPGPAGFPPIPITFRQIDADAVSQIAITDEIIINSTGVDWPDFHMRLLDHDGAAFNEELTNASGNGNGFATDPLVNQWFSPDGRDFWMDGFGAGPNGEDLVVAHDDREPWEPWVLGFGTDDQGNLYSGELYIDVKPTTGGPGDPFMVFTLKEYPTPEPSTALLILAGVPLLLRRKR